MSYRRNIVEMATRTSDQAQPGTMRERSPGHWQLRVFNGHDPVTGNPRQVARTFTGTERGQPRRSAHSSRRSTSGKFNRTRPPSGSSRQVAGAGQSGASGPGRSTRTDGRSRHGSVRSRRRPARQAGADRLDAAYRMWLDQGLSASTVHKYHCILSAACARRSSGGGSTGAHGPGHAAEGRADRDEGPDARPAVDAGEGCRGR